MSLENVQVTLSRFFDNNVQLVAKMCPRCYEECVDVRILAINLSFLNQIQNVNTKILDFLTKWSLRSSEESEDVFFGFNEEDMENSVKLSETFSGTVEDFAKKEVKRSDTNNNTDGENFFGFSRNEIENSREGYRQFLEVNKAVRHKIYRKFSLTMIKNMCNKKTSRHRKTNKRRNSVAQTSERQSKYFKIESSVEENQSKYFIKKEQIEVKLDNCQHIKSEPCSEIDMVDYEAEYFNRLNRNKFNVKTEHFVVKKEGYEEVKPILWIPPRSPHNLIEEVLYHDPWALLVATIFLNRTSCMCARPYVFWFLTELPNAHKVLDKFPQDLEKYFVKLGLQRTRAVQVWRMSHDFVHKDWKNVKELYGIGKYGEDAFRMFCIGDFSVAPKDRFLRIYKAWYEKVMMNGNMELVKKQDFEECVPLSDRCAF